MRTFNCRIWLNQIMQNLAITDTIHKTASFVKGGS
jgi:hypothetical protein